MSSTTTAESVLPPRAPLRNLLQLSRDTLFSAMTGNRYDQSCVQLELVKVGTYETHPAMFVLFKVSLALRQLDRLLFDIYFTTPKPDIVMQVKQSKPAPAPTGKRSTCSFRTLTRKTMAVVHQTHLRRSVLKGQIYQSLERYKNALLLGHATPFEAGQPVVVATGPFVVQGRSSNVTREEDVQLNVEPSIPTPNGPLNLGGYRNTSRVIHPDTPGGSITTTIHGWGIRVAVEAANVEGRQYPGVFSIGVVLQHTGPVDVLVLPASGLVERLKPELAIVHRLQDDMQGRRYPTCSHSSTSSASCGDTCKEFNDLHMSDSVWKGYLAAHWLKSWDVPSNEDGWVQYSHRKLPPRNPNPDGTEKRKIDSPRNPNPDETEKRKIDCVIA